MSVKQDDIWQGAGSQNGKGFGPIPGLHNSVARLGKGPAHHLLHCSEFGRLRIDKGWAKLRDDKEQACLDRAEV